MDCTSAAQVERRYRITDGLRPEILLDVQEILQTTHLYVCGLKSAYEFVNRTLRTTVVLSVKAEDQQEPMKEPYNASTVIEVVVLMPNNLVGQRGMILHIRSNKLQVQGLFVLHRVCDKYLQQLKSAYEFAKGQFPSYGNVSMRM